MSEATESKYADLLQGLGFKKCEDPPKGISMRCEFVETGSTRIQPGAPVHIPVPEYPCFITIGGVLSATFAWDETQQMWILAGEEIDMRTHGFSLMLQQFPLQ